MSDLLSPEDYTVRGLLYASQSNITSDHEQGFATAVVAYEMACTDHIREVDPTAAGEAAAKAALRAEQAGLGEREVDDWLDRSLNELPGNNDKTRRERAATLLLKGRTLGLRLTRAHLDKTSVRSEIDDIARTSFQEGNGILTSQHKLLGRWDPYATMLSRHRATYEAMYGSAPLAIAVAAAGIYRAVTARPENANQHLSRHQWLSLTEIFDDPRFQHLTFVGKQAGCNALAGSLALTRPTEQLPKLQQLRLKVAKWLLG